MRTFKRDSHGITPIREEHLQGRLPCMTMTAEMRTARLHLGTGVLVHPQSIKQRVSHRSMRRAARRYKRAQGSLALRLNENLLDAAPRWFEYAKNVLATDGHHVPLAFLLMPDGTGQFSTLILEDRQALYLLIKQLAARVERTGAVGLIYINEAWIARPEELTFGQRPSESPSRKEVLSLVAALRDGRFRHYFAVFSRDETSRIRFEPTAVNTEADSTPLDFLGPILQVWRKRSPQIPLDQQQ